MDLLSCGECGTAAAVVYLTTDYGATYCGGCCRRPAKAKPERLRGKLVKSAAELPAAPRADFVRHLYRLHDVDGGGCMLIRRDEAERWQAQGYGIYWAVNRFAAGVRQKEKLEEILAWAIDIDAGDKDAQRARFMSAPLVPSLIIETKRGYQAYWDAKDARSEHWNAIVWDRLVPYFGADKNARDLCRILRVPGYLHLKDPSAPFLVREVFRQGVAYTEAQMVAKFPDANSAAREAAEKREVKSQVQFSGSDGFWERVYRLDSLEALQRLSGRPEVQCEVFTFKRTSHGHNILVNGKGTSCWVDSGGHIGSLSGGGPTIAQWLKWMGMTYGDAARLIKEIFPEIAQ